MTAADELKAAVDDWNADVYDEEEKVRWHPDYSGRFMYGAQCIAISGDSFVLAEVWANLPKEQREVLGQPHIDDLGLGKIWYWPRIEAVQS